jgi:SAM-dependent methyltransferase
VRPPTDFDYDYFDNPAAYGYQGYSREKWSLAPTSPWKSVADYCVAAGVRSAVDVGCAKGFLVRELIAAGIDAHGFDVSDYALSFATELPCARGDIRDGLPLHAEAVIVLGVLQYLTEVELQRALSAIHAASHRLLLITCHYAESRQVVPDPLRVLTRPRQWWRERVSAAGFHFREQREFFEVFEKVGAPTDTDAFVSRQT